MTVLVRLLNGFLKLFVDDGSLAVTILIWVALSGLFMPPLLNNLFAGVTLFLGLALILAENAVRSARRLAQGAKFPPSPRAE